LSGGGTTTISLASGGAHASAFGSENFTTGKFYWEDIYTWATGSGSGLSGAGNINTTVAAGEFVGQTDKSVGWQASSGTIYYNSGGIGTVQTRSSGDRGAFALDLTNNKIWFKNLTSASGWNNDILANQNPATNTGGLALGNVTLAAVVPGAGLFNTSDTLTAYFASSLWTGTAPSGFGPFDASASCPHTLSLLGVGCGIWAAKKIEENVIVTRRKLILPLSGLWREGPKR
jgi:hypothetical protein